ncbi:hypothetical protein ES703_47429 [subsurface metagenome]
MGRNKKMEIIYARDQKVEDVQRVSDILNQKRKEVKKINIKVKCKNCDWEGQAIVGKKGYPLDNYKCPKCGRNIERARGRYNYHSESAQLK